MDDESDEDRPALELDDEPATSAHEGGSASQRASIKLDVAPGRVSKRYLDRLVLNLFIVEGYKDAAKAFAKESGIEPPTDLEAIDTRMQVRTAIMEGKVQEALAIIKERDEKILSENRKLHFDLQVQHLIELIRGKRADQALAFAREQLAPLGEGNREYLKQLEEALTLLAFKNAEASPLGHLLEVSNRSRTASEANAAMLASEHQETDPVLLRLLQHLAHSEPELKRAVNFQPLDWFTSSED